MEAALAIEHLSKSYGRIDVLHDISVRIAAGEFLVLVGPSGCGKSTLLNCIAGLEATTAGKIFIAGRDVTRQPPRSRDIAMVFQNYALYPTMTVNENIGFGMRIRKVNKSQMQKKIDRVALILQLNHLLDRKPAELSGGQRQRVAMGRALVRAPKLFLFDEPLSNLDAKLRVEMRSEIRKLHEVSQATIVYVTHDQIEAMTLATRIVVLKNGIVQQIGTPDEIYFSPANTFVADFMGSPPMNLLAATASEGAITLAAGQKIMIKHPLAAGKVVVGLRPEAIRLVKSNPRLRLSAQMVERSGADCFVSCNLGKDQLIARFAGNTRIAAGDRLQLDFADTAVIFFDASTGARIMSNHPPMSQVVPSRNVSSRT